jgi:tol-pal system protein YbgF
MPVLATLVILVVLATGCATRGSVRRTEGELEKLRTEVAALREAQASSRDQARTLSHLESIDGSLREIRTRLTQTAREVEGLNTRLRAAEDGLRGVRGEVAVARPAPGAIPAPPTTPTPPSALAPSPPPAPRPALMPPPAPTPAVVPVPTPRERPARETAPRGRTAEAAYGVALATYKAHEHGQAVLQFLDFLTRYPGHPLTINAQYWIGEAYYSQRDYRQALVEFQKVLQMPPPHGSGKPADALLKLGLCYANLREPANAEQAWQRLLQEYPRSESAARARTYLNTRRTSTAR